MKRRCVASAVACVLLLSGCTDDAKDSKKSESSKGGSKTTTTVKAPSLSMTNSEILKADPQFSPFVELVDLAGLTDELNSAEERTFLVPNTEAFAKIPQADLDKLKVDPSGALKTMLSKHILPKRYSMPELSLAVTDGLTAINGDKLAVTTNNGELSIEGIRVVKGDIRTKTGTIHVLESVIGGG